jgi:hypothetical protein
MVTPAERSSVGHPIDAGSAHRTSLLCLAYAGFFLVAFALTVVMLVTDRNLRTDFGSVSGYYLHWWVVLITGVADILGAALLLALGSRRAVSGGVLGSALIAAIFLGDIATYSTVGFASASAFAKYLFGVTYSGGDIRYLYDILLAVYIATVIYGCIVLLATRSGVRAAPREGEVPVN